MAISLNINGTSRSVNSDPDTPLLWVIRDELRLTGTKYGCGIAHCSACTVQLDGTAVRSASPLYRGNFLLRQVPKGQKQLHKRLWSVL